MMDDGGFTLTLKIDPFGTENHYFNVHAAARPAFSAVPQPRRRVGSTSKFARLLQPIRSYHIRCLDGTRALIRQVHAPGCRFTSSESPVPP